ncbi:hypothetical protein [Sorangium sp. So ce341]|uniref:hypothetical protein n=1 Tax=Sorangium sp. So ce341 TaxID=3133302 RepID=UPI003F62E7C7
MAAVAPGGVAPVVQLWWVDPWRRFNATGSLPEVAGLALFRRCGSALLGVAQPATIGAIGHKVVGCTMVLRRISARVIEHDNGYRAGNQVARLVLTSRPIARRQAIMRSKSNSRVLWILSAGVLAGLSLTAGCQIESNEPHGAEGTGAGDPGAGDQGGAGGQGGGGGSGEAGGAPVTCDSRPGNHDDACPADAPCAVTLDVEVTCTDYRFAYSGVMATPAAGATYLVTKGAHPTRLFELDDEGVTQRDLDMEASSMGVALSPDGKAYAAVDAMEGSRGGFPRRLVFLPLAGGATENQPVLDPEDRGALVYGFAMGSRGEPHIWLTGDSPDSFAHATRTPSGTWDVVPAGRPSGSGGTRFTLAPDDTPLAFGLEKEGLETWQLEVLDGTTERSLGAPVSARYALEYDPIAPPQPAGEATIPRFAAVVQHPDGLRLASAAEGDGFDEIAIPGTATPTYQCQRGWHTADLSEPTGGCPAECREVTSGIEWSAFSAARTSDGDVWIAFVISHIDWTIDYEVFDHNGTLTCTDSVAADESRGELRLVRVPHAGGAPEVTLVLPLPALGHDGSTASSRANPLVHVSAFGAELTVAVRTLASPVGPSTARALRIDTSLLAPVALGD